MVSMRHHIPFKLVFLIRSELHEEGHDSRRRLVTAGVRNTRSTEVSTGRQPWSAASQFGTIISVGLGGCSPYQSISTLSKKNQRSNREILIHWTRLLVGLYRHARHDLFHHLFDGKGDEQFRQRESYLVISVLTMKMVRMMRSTIPKVNREKTNYYCPTSLSLIPW